MTRITLLDRFLKIGPLASVALAVSIIFTGWVQRSAVGDQTVQETQQRVGQLEQQVTSLQQQLAKQGVIENELQNLKDGQITTQKSVDRLADELHSWQRQEQRIHAH